MLPRFEHPAQKILRLASKSMCGCQNLPRSEKMHSKTESSSDARESTILGEICLQVGNGLARTKIQRKKVPPLETSSKKETRTYAVLSSSKC